MPNATSTNVGTCVTSGEWIPPNSLGVEINIVGHTTFGAWALLFRANAPCLYAVREMAGMQIDRDQIPVFRRPYHGVLIGRKRMPATRPAMVLGALLAIVAPHAYADDVANGQELAKEWCARCHNTEPGGPFKQYPPSFASIAVYRSVEQIHSRIMLPPLHTSMPQLGFFLTPDNVDDLVAYIVSLETQ